MVSGQWSERRAAVIRDSRDGVTFGRDFAFLSVHRGRDFSDEKIVGSGAW